MMVYVLIDWCGKERFLDVKMLRGFLGKVSETLWWVWGKRKLFV